MSGESRMLRSGFVLRCEQAIFTSVRTAMGEGYRIIAASKGLRPDQKQVITRNAPSHDAICPGQPLGSPSHSPVVGFAFYPLPGGRLCTCVTSFAGAEHTGRGGQRVYTHCVALDAAHFGACGYSPFPVLRAMVEHGLASPQLKPPPVLEELQLPVDSDRCPARGEALRTALPSLIRRHVLEGLLRERAFIVSVQSDWFDLAEALILGIPGPARAKFAFSVGLKYSMGRGHRLHILHDTASTTKNRLSGQKVEFVDVTTVPPQTSPESSTWVAFVDRLWERGDTARLARRTSRPFRDGSVEHRERIARWYHTIDTVDQAETAALLSSVGDTWSPVADSVETEVRGELHSAVQDEIRQRFQRMPWVQISLFWSAIVQIWRHGVAGCAFAQPLIAAALGKAMREDPMAAGEAAMAVARDIPEYALTNGHPTLLDEVIRRLAECEAPTAGGIAPRLKRIFEGWQRLRPQCPLIARSLQSACVPVHT